MSPAANDPLVQQALAQLRAQLSPARVRVQLVTGNALVAADRVGALAVVGMKTEQPPTRVSAYIFRTWGEAKQGLRAVKELAPQRADLCTVEALNGRMALYGQGVGEGAQAAATRHVLNNILAAFEEE